MGRIYRHYNRSQSAAGKRPELDQFRPAAKKAVTHRDPFLGLELLRSLFSPYRARLKLDPLIQLSPKKIIVFSVFSDKTQEIADLGVPEDQIIYKAHSNLNTLPKLIEKIEEKYQ